MFRVKEKDSTGSILFYSIIPRTKKRLYISVKYTFSDKYSSMLL